MIDRRIQIVVIGDGSRFDWLVQQQKKYKIDNLIILGRYRFELMSYFFKAADALLITLKADSNNLNYLSLVTPGKIQAYMAAGKPIIASIDGDGKNTIIDADCGLVSDAENVDMLVNNIHKIYKMSSKKRCLMGKRGRIFFDDNFEIRKQVKKLIELLSERI